MQCHRSIATENLAPSLIFVVGPTMASVISGTQPVHPINYYLCVLYSDQLFDALGCHLVAGECGSVGINGLVAHGSVQRWKGALGWRRAYAMGGSIRPR